LKPAPERQLAIEMANLAGGAEKLAERAQTLIEDGQSRLAAHLVEFASNAEPDNRAIQATRASVYEQCMEDEKSLIGRAIFAVYQRDAKLRATS